MRIKYSTITKLLLVVIITLASCAKTEVDYTQYVNPFIGADYMGNTYPGATTPFGMVQLSPDNGLPGWDRIAGYYYPDSTIAGFSHTHLTGTGAGDLYDISYLPVTLPYNESEPPLGIHSKFLHETEQATAGYYRVLLQDYNIEVELTATDRCGVQRYIFPEGESAILLNLSKYTNWDATLATHIEVIDSVTIAGYRYSTGWAENQKVYFVTKLSKPFMGIAIDTVDVVKEGMPTVVAHNAKLYYNTAKNDTVILRTAISQTGIDGAMRNLLAEAPHNNFDKYRSDAKDKWNKELSKIEITTDNDSIMTIFYTALYHTMTAPTISSDVDGAYRGLDDKVHRDSTKVSYGTFSLWDTYRTAHPLYTYLCPDRVNDMVKSFLDHYNQFGRLPVWSFFANETDMMIGYHSVPVIVDAYLKGIGDFDAKAAIEACIFTANYDSYRGIGEYKKFDYLPYDKESESLSKTIEYSFDDWCIAEFAKSYGYENTAKIFYSRAKNYRNLYNPQNGFLQPKDSKGEFIKDFNPKEYTEHITESNAWQYLFAAHHDIEWMIDTMGVDGVREKLDAMFTTPNLEEDNLPIFSTGMIGQYAHGNEPSHHVAYIYNLIGEGYKTQKYVSDILYNFYDATPSGLCGNEDCGQMSAWYIFSAMGFYPLNPVSLQYQIGSPIVSEAKLHLANGKTFTVKSNNLSPENCYVESIKIDGKTYNKTYITHNHIINGSTVTFNMSSKPNIDIR